MKHLGKTAATAALVLTALATPAAVALQSDDRPASSTVQLAGDLYVRSELFFGSDRPDPKPDVSDYEFKKFVDRTVTPRFPAGLTILSGEGQWQEDDKTVTKERSKVIIIVYKVADNKVSSKRIEEIRDLYKKQFDQQSVMRADSLESVGF